jgi:hypothetical protein
MDWDQIGGDPEAEDCIKRLAEIFSEQIVHITLFARKAQLILRRIG